VLHDRTAEGVFKVLGAMDNVNVTIVPFRLGRGGAVAAGAGTGTAQLPLR
jgi:hypothetical protein